MNTINRAETDKIITGEKQHSEVFAIADKIDNVPEGNTSVTVKHKKLMSI